MLLTRAWLRPPWAETLLRLLQLREHLPIGALVALGKDGISKNGFGVLGYDTTSGVGGELKRYMGLQHTRSDDGYDLVEMKGNLDLISFTHALTPVTGSWTTAYREAPSPQLLIYMLVRPQPCMHIQHLMKEYTVVSPFILVPNGSPFFPIKAQALSSNLTTIPSFL